MPPTFHKISAAIKMLANGSKITKTQSAVVLEKLIGQFLFDKADVVVSLDCDFLGSEGDLHNHIRRYAKRRHIEKPEDPLNRLYVVESLMTLTGFGAEHRLRLPPSAVLQVAAALAAR